ncbi:TRAP transporter substrate-binding protein [Parathalassolituus penaei]|uniref:TRAP transporter substrate-binding protein n=1 Tax=Parathalassolituus penaei TaxID=2997323 RepID=A0A9X3EJV6_9GAMM|nr:TRAP transporter substrate-binding protein [Parathalassolituus penaei]MCY0965656.1 TRAP transporter substrate-binding protein [Parathalassolituus penaei]
MKSTIKKLSVVVASVLSVSSFGWSSAATAAEVNLRFAHFWPATSGIAKTLDSWAKQVEADSNGRIRVEMYPAQTLAKAVQTYDSVVKGIADVGVSIQGYTANRFPITQIVELPGIVQTGEQGSCVVQNLYQEGTFKGEYDDAHVLFMFTHGPGHIHTKGKLVKEPHDVAGMMIRRPTVVAGELLKGLGAEPVGLAAPEMYGAMSRGVINGVALPWEAMTSFRLNELADKHTEIGLYSLAFVATMNSRTYQRLPADLKAVIDRNSGVEWSRKLGAAYDVLDINGVEQARALGHEIHTVEGGVENPAWKPVVDAAVKHYATELESKGIKVGEIYQHALQVSDRCES